MKTKHTPTTERLVMFSGNFLQYKEELAPLPKTYACFGVLEVAASYGCYRFLRVPHTDWLTNTCTNKINCSCLINNVQLSEMSEISEINDQLGWRQRAWTVWPHSVHMTTNKAVPSSVSSSKRLIVFDFFSFFPCLAPNINWEDDNNCKNHPLNGMLYVW